MGIEGIFENGIGEVLLTEEQIAARVRDLGRQISDDYRGKELLLVGVLKGAFIFLADLARNINVPVSIDFTIISSYRSSTTSSGIVTVERDLAQCVEGKHVILVEDIVDTGWTLKLSYLREKLFEKKAASVRVCTLLDKPSRRMVDVDLDYVGFEVPDKFVVGYGLDFDGLYRNLPCICALDSSKT